MANYSNLKTAIENAVDWNNGDNEITGQNLLDILETIIDSLGAKYKFADVATPASSITTPDEPLFYLAGEGTYTNFSGLSVTIPRGTLAIFYYDTAWHYTTVRTDSDAFFNVNQYLGAPSATYTKANGRNAVPEALRSKGMIITYLTTDGWIIEQNLSTSGTWNADANWQTIGPVSVSQNTETGQVVINIGTESKTVIDGVDSVPDGASDNFVKSSGIEKRIIEVSGKIIKGGIVETKEIIEAESVLTNAYNNKYNSVGASSYTLRKSGAATRCVAFYPCVKGEKYEIHIPLNSNDEARTVCYTSSKMSGALAEDTSISGLVLDSPIGGSTSPIDYTINSADEYDYIAVSYIGDSPVVVKTHTEEYPNTLENVDDIERDIYGYSETTDIEISPVSVVSKAYLDYQNNNPQKVVVSLSSNATRCVAFYPCVSGKKYKIHIPLNTNDSSRIVEYTDEYLSGELSRSVSLDGAFIESPIGGGNNPFDYTIETTLNHAYIAVSYIRDAPTVLQENVIYHKGIKKEIYGEEETETKTLAPYSTATKAYMDMNVAVGTDYVRANTSSSSNSCIAFYLCQKGKKYNIHIPKNNNDNSRTVVYSDKSLTGELAEASRFDGYVIDSPIGGGSEPIEYTILSALDRGFIAVSYNASEGAPTVTEQEIITVGSLKKDVENLSELSNADLYDLEDAKLLKAYRGKYTLTSVQLNARSFCFDDLNLYVGYAEGHIVKLDISDESNVVESASYNLNDVNHTFTGIKIDDNYVYAVTRDKLGGLTPPADKAGLLIILNKSDLSVVSTTELRWRAMQCYLRGTLLVIPLQLKGWCIYDVSNPASPSVHYDYVSPESNQEYQFADFWSVNGRDYAAFTAFGAGVWFWDITNTSNPTYISKWYPRMNKQQEFGIKVRYPYAYVTTAPMWDYREDSDVIKGIFILELTDLTIIGEESYAFKTIVIPSTDTPTVLESGDPTPNYLSLCGNLIVVNNGSNGLAVFRIVGRTAQYVRTVPFSKIVMARPIECSPNGLIVAGADKAQNTYFGINLWRFKDYKTIE